MQQPEDLSHQMLLTVLDSLDAIIYVADLDTYELLFLNKFARDIFGENSIGRPCWDTLQSGQSGPCEFCSNAKLVSPEGENLGMYAWEFQNTLNGHWYDIRDRAITWTDGRTVRLEIATDITDRKLAEQERERLLAQLQDAQSEVTTLRGIIPICSYCKQIRDDEGYWSQVEVYVSERSDADFSHSICPVCVETHHPTVSQRLKIDRKKLLSKKPERCDPDEK